MTNQEIAKNLVDLVGGKSNIISVQNCMTRCRLELNDYSKVDMDKLKTSEGVLGVVKGEGQLQVIYGPGKVEKITKSKKTYNLPILYHIIIKKSTSPTRL